MNTDLDLKVRPVVQPNMLELHVEARNLSQEPLYLQNVYLGEETGFNDNRPPQGASTDAANVLPLGDGKLLIHQGTREPNYWPEYMVFGPRYQRLLPGERLAYIIHLHIPLFEWIPPSSASHAAQPQREVVQSALFVLEYFASGAPQPEVDGYPGVFGQRQSSRSGAAAALVTFEQPLPIQCAGPPPKERSGFEPGEHWIPRMTHWQLFRRAGGLPAPYDQPYRVPHPADAAQVR